MNRRRSTLTSPRRGAPLAGTDPACATAARLRGRRSLALAAALVALAGAGTHVEAAPPPARPADAEGTLVVPRRFLRRWDPVTWFFAADVPGASVGEVGAPAQVSLSPAHPGGYRWLDARTLQFRPDDPWPPGATVTASGGGATARLEVLLPAPSETSPEDGENHVAPSDTVTLNFGDPLPVATVADRLRVEVRPLPALDPAAARFYEGAALSVKPMADSPGRFQVRLPRALPPSSQVRLHFRLAAADPEDAPFHTVTFTTAAAFRASSVSVGYDRVTLPAGGLRMSADQALSGGADDRTVRVGFGAPLGEVGPLVARSLIALDPAVDDLEVTAADQDLTLRGSFESATLYRLRLDPSAPLTSEDGRALEGDGPSEVWFHFQPKARFLRVARSRGVLELRGPQVLPMQGRGHDRVDLRVHRVDPLSRRFWPWPERSVSHDDDTRPPGPGEEPEGEPDRDRDPTPAEIRGYLGALGTPAVADLIDLPLTRRGPGASFGLDLEPYLRRAAGDRAPGTYLVGLRALGKESQREWVRLQVTDLTFTTLEHPDRRVALVTSLATGAPVEGAQVVVEGQRANDSTWRVLADRKTNAKGEVELPDLQRPGVSTRVRRIVVRKDGDVLTLDARHPPEVYQNGSWRRDWNAWLQSTPSRTDSEDLAHLYSDRPVYKPGEEVHLRAYLRRKVAGRLQAVTGKVQVVVQDPSGRETRTSLQLSNGGVYHLHATEADGPTGTFRWWVETDHPKRRHRRRLSTAHSFKVEAFRVPRFEVNLHAPDQVALDAPFEVGLTARYYAGGRAEGLDVEWSVSHRPLSWSPASVEGWYTSSDGRYSRAPGYETAPSDSRGGTTDASGADTVEVDPSREPDARPRTYTIEATVTGPDGQTVTSVQRVRAVPAFVLAAKLPRVLAPAEALKVQAQAVGPDGAPVSGRPLTIRLKSRRWHSHLQASDFSTGVPRWVTEPVDEVVHEVTRTSGEAPIEVALPADRAGVWVVEVESRDTLGRSQMLSVDVFRKGNEAVAWEKPESRVFRLSADAGTYTPGETATVVIRSPFQQARAVVAIESPAGLETRAVEVRGGQASFEVKIDETMAPRLPVHVLLWRGRVEAPAPTAESMTDLGKPQTLASTHWLRVDPTHRKLEVTLDAPARATPGEEIDVEVSLTTPDGKPAAGEVTLWLVDRAVLALGKETPLDPLGSFLGSTSAQLRWHDTRGMTFGRFPFAKMPGGDGMDDMMAMPAAARMREMSAGAGPGGGGGLLSRLTVRRNFATVPFFRPDVAVGPSGKVTVKVKLPDNLTVFALRAKATSGAERFGFAKGKVAIRQPLVVQPSLPRFVRAGDEFRALAIARVVEGPDGPGEVELQVAGAERLGGPTQAIAFEGKTPVRVEFPVRVPTPPLDAEGELSRTQVGVTVGAQRKADGAGDAFAAYLPLRPEVEPVVRRHLEVLTGGARATLPGLPEAARSGSVQRQLAVVTRPEVARILAGVDALRAYPHGCTEQRLSRARGFVAARRLGGLLGSTGMAGEAEQVDGFVRDLLAWLPSVTTSNQLISYWPGGQGYVSLTAWVLEFLVEAEAAGYQVEQNLKDRLVSSLTRALRSDYTQLVDGGAYIERCMAMAALASAGKLEDAYAVDMGRRADALSPDGRAAVLLALARSGDTTSFTVRDLVRSLVDDLVTRTRGGRDVYAGLADDAGQPPASVLPSEARTLSWILRALRAVNPSHPLLPTLLEGLVNLGRAGGWGSTQADGAALLALADVLQPKAEDEAARIRILGPGVNLHLDVPAGGYVVKTFDLAPTFRVTREDRGGEPLLLRVQDRYLPATRGADLAAEARGFAVTRARRRVAGDGTMDAEQVLQGPGETLAAKAGETYEEVVRVVAAGERHFVAVVIPLAGGMEPMNPELDTSPSSAKPSQPHSLRPTWSSYTDHQVALFFDHMPAGTHTLRFRTRAQGAGTFTQPPARAEAMYDAALRGRSPGAQVRVEAAEE